MLSVMMVNPDDSGIMTMNFGMWWILIIVATNAGAKWFGTNCLIDNMCSLEIFNL